MSKVSPSPEVQIAEILKRSGIAFDKTESPGAAAFRAADFDRNKGFRIEILETSTNLLINFGLESMAADLARMIRGSLSVNLEQVQNVIQAQTGNSKMVFRVNDKPFTDIADTLSEAPWFNFAIEDIAEKAPFADELAGRVNALMALVLTILSAEDAPKDSSASEHDLEGAVREGSFTSYERSAKNRRICLSIHGFDCKVCGLNLEKKYGEVARSFIHVHHINPVSLMGGEGPVNPHLDLIPVCPSCHYVMHRETPPISPSDLVKMIEAEAEKGHRR